MLKRPLSHSLAIWGAWVVAGAAGSFAPILPRVLNFDEPVLPGGISPSLPFYEVTFAAISLAFVQYIVLSLVVGRVSLTALTWIPVTLIAAIVASNVDPWNRTVPGTSISLGGIETQLLHGYMAVPIWLAVRGIATGLVLGLAQGILLAQLSEQRVIVVLWMSANVLAGVIVGIVMGIQMQEYATQGVSQATFFADTVFNGALYAAVTGPVLLLLSDRKLATLTRPVKSQVGV